MAQRRLRVLEFFCAHGDARLHLVETYPRQRIDYTGMDERPTVSSEFVSRALPPGHKVHVDRLHAVALALSEPERLGEQLASLLGKQRFDLVYAVMPPTRRNLPDQRGALPVVARFLRPGGRIVHVAEASNEFLGLALRNHTELPLGPHNVEEIYRINRARLDALGSAAGLTVVSYAQKPEDSLWQANYAWYSEDAGFDANHFSTSLARLTRSVQYARHAVVFEKPVSTTGSTSAKRG